MPSTTENARLILSRIARLLVCAITLGSGAPDAARAGVNVWTSSGPDAPGVNALAVGILGYVPYSSSEPAHFGYPVPIVYAGTAGEGVFRSVDLGASWQAINAGLEHTYIESLLTDPSRPMLAYAASPNRGVFKSEDAGNTWTAVNDGLSSPSAHLMAADLGSGVLYVTNNDGLFASCDDGATWTPTALRTRREDRDDGEVALDAWIDCLAADSMAATVYACFFSWDEGASPSWQLLKSVDDGASWHTVALPALGGPVAVATDRGMPNTVFVATYDPLGGARVLESRDGGVEWRYLGGALPGCDGFCRVTGLQVDSHATPVVYAATTNGVYTISEDGATWQPLNTGIAGLTVDSVVVDYLLPAVLYAGTPVGAFSIFREAGMCAGDCNGDGAVRVPELVAMVGIALDQQGMVVCGAGDGGGDGRIAVDDLVAAVGSALTGCR